MGKVVFAIVAAIASFVLVEALTCNKCSFGLLGVCLNSGDETCATNTSVCFTAKATFPGVSNFAGFNTQGCTEPAGCGNFSGTLLGASYDTMTECCSTDKCNPVQISGAPSTKLPIMASIGAAILASTWAGMLY